MKIDPKIKEELKKYLKEREKKEAEKVRITSAYKLSQEEVNVLIQKFPSFKKAEIEEDVDPDIIAGVIIRQGSNVLDYSLIGMVNQLKNMTHEIA